MKETEEKKKVKTEKEEKKKETKVKKSEKEIEEPKKVEKKEKKAKEVKKAAPKDKTKKESKPKAEKKDKKKKTEKVEEEPENVEVFSINLSVLIVLFIILVIIIGIIAYLYFKPTQMPSNEVDVNEIVENQTETNTPRQAVEFDVETQMRQINEYLRLKSIALSSPQALLETYGFATNQKFAGYPKTDDEIFIKTDISYEAIRNALQSHITKDFFASEFKNIYKPSNGVTHVANTEKPREYYEVKRHEKLDTKGKPIIQVWYTTKVDGVESEQKTMKVEFSTYNGRWLISGIK